MLVGTLPADAVFEIVRSGAGVTVKFVTLFVVPDAFTIVITPVLALAGTIAVICVLLSMVNDALTLLNFTNVLEKKFEPVMTTVWPMGPLVGANELMVGGELGLMFVVSVSLLFDVVPSG